MTKAICVEPIYAFNDNYIWLLTTADGKAYVVDPGDAQPVLEALHQRNLTLSGILITHWHPDHTGGVEALKAVSECTVWGPKNETIRGIDHYLDEGDSVALAGITFSIIKVPGHTLDHIAYVGDGILFCGDALFVAGCGRVFEGTFPMMRHSLDKLRQLPKATRVFCAHEYTESNLRFAVTADPENNALQQHNERCQELRSRGEPTVPSTLEVECATNPFLRWDDPDLAQQLVASGRCNTTAADEVFEALRSWKDTF